MVKFAQTGYQVAFHSSLFKLATRWYSDKSYPDSDQICTKLSPDLMASPAVKKKPKYSVSSHLFRGYANARDTGALPLPRLAHHLGRGAGVLRRLVRVVAAVVRAVADEGLVDALRVVALEVVVLTVDDSARLGLVALVLAVGGAVAVPSLIMIKMKN